MSEKINLSLIGGFIAGIATLLCCTGPLVLLSLGFVVHGSATWWHLNLIARYS